MKHDQRNKKAETRFGCALDDKGRDIGMGEQHKKSVLANSGDHRQPMRRYQSDYAQYADNRTDAGEGVDGRSMQ